MGIDARPQSVRPETSMRRHVIADDWSVSPLGRLNVTIAGEQGIMLQWWIWLFIALAPSFVVGVVWPIGITKSSDRKATRGQNWAKR